MSHEPPKRRNPCSTCGVFLWDDPRPCWNCARIAMLKAQGQTSAASLPAAETGRLIEELESEADKLDGYNFAAKVVPLLRKAAAALRNGSK